MKFKANGLTTKTSEADRTKLVSALKGVHGVEKATLHPGSSEFEITARAEEVPKHTEIKVAAENAGFKTS